jgi:hypothetical protein
MKTLQIVILSLFFIQFTFAQSSKNLSSNYQILIESLPDSSGKNFDMNFSLDNLGTYSFKLSESLIIPEGYQIMIEEKITGNTFNLDSYMQHSFSVSRAMTKQFVVCLRKRQLVKNN